MTVAAARRVAWAAFVLEVLLTGGAFAFGLGTPSHGGTPRPAEELAFWFLTLPFPIVGFAILARQPRNAIGWILMGIGLAWLASTLAVFGDFALAHGLPGGPLALTLSFGMWAPPIGLLGTVLLLRFPDGRLVAPRWRWVERVAVASVASIVALIDLAPRSLAEAGYEGLRNPVGLQVVGRLQGVLGPVALVFSLSIAASAVSLVLRFRRSRGVERLQMKWLASSAAFVATIFLVGMAASLATPDDRPEPLLVTVVDNLAVASFLLIPVAIGFAVLRLRLYEIDRVVNRTLVYGTLSALLAGLYAGLVLGLGALVRSAGGSSDSPIVVAASTLTAAALFRPLRARVQGLVDRRFYRHGYDAQRTLESFSARLRDDVDLRSLAGELEEVVRQTVQPVRVGLWLRSPTGGQA